LVDPSESASQDAPALDLSLMSVFREALELFSRDLFRDAFKQCFHLWAYS
jgi:hypothetical protein